MKICPVCGKEYNEPSALSRRKNVQICSMCGLKEALEDAINTGVLSKDSINLE